MLSRFVFPPANESDIINNIDKTYNKHKSQSAKITVKQINVGNKM